MEHLSESSMVRKRHRDLMRQRLLEKNPLLASGLALTPAIAVTDTFIKAVYLAITFSVVTLFTLIFASFVPKRIVYAIRIIIYTVIASLIYAVVAIMLNTAMPSIIESMSIYFPLLIINSLIISRSEAIFSHIRKTMMIIDIIFSVLGYAIAVVIFGFIRELLWSGGISGNAVAMPIIYPVFGTVYGGFLLLGLFVVAHRALKLFLKRVK